MKDEEKKVLSPADSAKVRETFNPDSDLPPDADAEERFNDFWKKNGVVIFGVIGLIAVLITGFQGYELMQKRAEVKLQESFAGVEGADAKLQFAREHADHSLGGLAYLEVADDEYANREFVQASEHYEAAIEPLTSANSPLSSRARLGAALARLRQGQDQGLFLLQEVAQDPEVIEVIRAQAAYHHAVASWEKGDVAAVRRSLDLLDTFDGARNWQAAGQSLASQIPELQEAEEAAAEEGGLSFD